MFLKYIEIHGFKSFPDKTRIEFEQGLTAIVGPNGSGKSNISDAIRWVLGEQSSKSLRGTKMEDVVFDGSKNRGAMGYASVTLCLDNTDGRIPDVGPKLLIGRRYYRSGDSEYTINGAAARLRDVREMFLDTGLGRDGYSIIGQGRIDAIVAAKSSDRREIFEEASGIAKYRFRKEEADRRLTQAQENIERLRDILDELEARVGPLETQSRKAKEFLALSEQRRGLEITLYCDTIRRTRDQLREQVNKLAVAKAEYTRLSDSMTDIEQRIEHNSELSREYAVRIDRCNSEINGLAERQGVLEGELAVLQNDLSHHEEEYRRFGQELSAFDDTDGEIAGTEKRLKEAIEQNGRDVAAAESEIEQASAELADIIVSGESSDKLRTQAAGELAEATARLTDIRVQAVSEKSSAEAGERRIEAIEDALAENSEALSSLNEQLSAAERAFDSVQKEITRAENRRDGLTLKLAGKNEAMQRLNGSINSAVFAANECSHRIKILTDLEQTMEGYAGSVRRIVQARRDRELKGVVGTVASLLTIEPGYEVAIEAAIGAALQNIVVEDESAAKAAIAYLKQARAGRATFLPLTTIRPSQFDGTLGAGARGMAADFVRYDSRYQAVVSNLLGRIIVAEDIDAAADIARRNRHRFRVVTMDGQLVNVGGSFTGGYIAKGSGVLSRRAEIEEQQKRLTGLEQQIKELRDKAAAESAEVGALNEQMASFESEIVGKNEERVRTEALADGLRAQRDAAETAHGSLQAECEALRAELDRRTAELSRLASEQQLLEARTAELEKSAREGSAADYIERRAKAQDRVGELKLRRMELLKDGEALADQLRALHERLQSVDERRAECRRLYEIAGQLAEAKRKELEAHRAKLAAVADDIVFRRGEIAECIENRNKKEQETVGLRAKEKECMAERENMTREAARLEERRAAAEQESERTVARLWEEYELTPAEAEGLCVPFERVSDLRAEVGALRQKIKSLGHVNVAAIDEYKAVVERRDFLKAQYNDVNASRLELMRLIESLMKEMTELFTDSFGRISENFTRIFTELFGGGEAKVYLTDENDVLESGIEIDAHPPGKIIKNISSLSGGEKALVAIALYFAMLSVNPSPFCVLDEIDTALDDSNVIRFARYINTITDKTQFLAITHRRGTMENAAVLYGVTMQEEGVSRLLKLDVESVDATLIR